jgi:hypothetical protein
LILGHMPILGKNIIWLPFTLPPVTPSVLHNYFESILLRREDTKLVWL